MQRIALLTLTREDELEWRSILTDYFSKTGDWLCYALFPSLVLPGRDSIDGKIDIGDGRFRLSDAPVFNGFCWVLPADRQTGLFLTRNKDIGIYAFPSGDVRVNGAALVETEENRYRVIQRRPLSRDRGN